MSKTKQAIPKKFAFHCTACGMNLNNFTNSHLLPNGEEDDLCTNCKESIYYSYSVPFTDHDHAHVTEGITSPHFSDDMGDYSVDD